MSWGIRITLLYLGFVALILTLVFTCMGEKVELESKDYYAKELKFQNQINATDNVNTLSVPITHLVKNKTVELSIPQELMTAGFKGEAYFFRPSDSDKDKAITLNPDANGKQILSDASFIKGVYKLKISIESNGKSYYKEDVIYFE